MKPQNMQRPTQWYLELVRGEKVLYERSSDGSGQPCMSHRHVPPANPLRTCFESLMPLLRCCRLHERKRSHGAVGVIKSAVMGGEDIKVIPRRTSLLMSRRTYVSIATYLFQILSREDPLSLTSNTRIILAPLQVWAEGRNIIFITYIAFPQQGFTFIWRGERKQRRSWAMWCFVSAPSRLLLRSRFDAIPCY